MVERITLYKLLDEQCHEAGRADARRRLREGLEGVSGIASLRVGWPCDDASLRSWDVALIATFADAQTAEQVMASPEWQRVVHEDVGASAVVTKGWSFEMQG